MPRFQIRDLLISVALVAGGMVLLRIAVLDVLLSVPVLNFGRGFFGAPPLVFCVLVIPGFALVGAGLFYPFKRARSGALIGVIISMVVLVLIATDFLNKLLPL